MCGRSHDTNVLALEASAAQPVTTRTTIAERRHWSALASRASQRAPLSCQLPAAHRGAFPATTSSCGAFYSERVGDLSHTVLGLLSMKGALVRLTEGGARSDGRRHFDEL
jgi:hypothetical protein